MGFHMDAWLKGIGMEQYVDTMSVHSFSCQLVFQKDVWDSQFIIYVENSYNLVSGQVPENFKLTCSCVFGN